MRRSTLAFLTASLLFHGALGSGGVWLAKHARDQEEARRPARPTFAGDTFEVAEEDESRSRIAESVIAQPDERERAGETETVRPKLHAAIPGGTFAAHPVDVPLTYGALGDRSAVDVTVALARGFPQAASTDPIWRSVPFGDAGSATMEIDLEPDGTLARWSLGAGASPALRQAVTRTMAFIGSRAFLARGSTTKLTVSARVTADAVRDGNDAVYAIHSEHDGARASAYFSLASGRRIDLTIAPK